MTLFNGRKTKKQNIITITGDIITKHPEKNNTRQSKAYTRTHDTTQVCKKNTRHNPRKRVHVGLYVWDRDVGLGIITQDIMDLIFRT